PPAPSHLSLHDALPISRPGDPDSPRVLARSNSAGATHLFAAACRKRGVRFSFGFPVDERVQRIVDLIPDQCWHPAIEDEGLRDGDRKSTRLNSSHRTIS